ncbi:MAG: alpha-D-ribose 1-methylphosphonate 5-triphosphate diphosphatase [Hyphomicrobiaceae bacterium]
MSESTPEVLTHARIVLPDSVIDNGWVAIENGVIAEVGVGKPPEKGNSLGGDMLIPGLIELHTDHLETHLEPRPKVEWHQASAVLAYDAQIAAAGITTVFDCLRVGTDRDIGDRGGARARRIVGALERIGRGGNLRAEHHTHLRCEVSSDDVIEAARSILESHSVGLISLMDHTPGQRQFRDVDKLRTYYRAKLQMSEDELEAFFSERYRMHERNSIQHRRALVSLAQLHSIPLASHDDTTLEHVAESAADGAVLAEFPTTAEAARASHDAGIAVVMGAPNLIRGGSHSGNVAASDLASEGLLDIFSSDYIPASLIMAAFQLKDHGVEIELPEAVATVTSTPARAAGLLDRGEIAVGKRADLVHVFHGETPIVRTVWREGRRVI